MQSTPPPSVSTQCCIAGGGPAGVMLGYILARAGVNVIVLEKHEDFFRDFRGDTIHPSTFTVLNELGLLNEFLKVKHDELHELTGRIGGVELKLVNFRFVPGPCKFLGFMPQWDFLNFLTEQGRKLSTFRLEMKTEATDLLYEGDTVVGVRAQTASGPIEIRAPLVVAADGRDSRLRERAQMRPRDYGVPIDVLWMRISRKETDRDSAFGNIAPGGILVTIDRRSYYQCAFVIRKGGFDDIKQRGIEYLRQRIVELAPYLGDRVRELKSFDDVSLLTVTVNRLPVWARPGLQFIGDAAHAMSPIGGVGINLAIQDAVAAANILAGPLKNRTLSLSDLSAIQRRREFPTKVIQGIQLLIQNKIMTQVLNTTQTFKPPLILRMLDRIELLRNIPAYIVGIGPRPEHINPSLLR
jgi:2-polyprenyl-6-methoxyphenol hydroxylase-like FAD-dependent oxidoreductase